MAIRRGFLLIRAQFVLHSAYSYLIRNWFLNFRAACSNVILLFVMNSCAIPAELSRFSRIFVTKSYLNRDWLVHHHDWRIFFNETSRIPRINKKSIRGNSGDSWPVWNRGIIHTGHESPESPRIDFLLIRGDSWGFIIFFSPIVIFYESVPIQIRFRYEYSGESAQFGWNRARIRFD